MKLELKHLAPYLPYGLSFSVNLNDVRDNFPDELRTLNPAETEKYLIEFNIRKQ